MRRIQLSTVRRQVATTIAKLSFKPRIKELQFVAYDVLDLPNHYQSIGASDCNKDLLDTLLEEAGKLCTSSLFPCYMEKDDVGCRLQGENVLTPSGYKEAYKALVEGGWTGISGGKEYGGQGLPQSVTLAVRDLMASANWPFVMYPGLSDGAAHTLTTWGSEEQRKTYLPKMFEGVWTGTMCLTEPQCGTDLSQVKTKAVPQADGTYHISGTKIFISSGDHDLAENIVHIVLARLPNAPKGLKGISLFLVPRHLVKPDGTLEKKKNLLCTGLEHKMGIKGSATCQMTFEKSVGYMIGSPNEGLAQMFTFMNTARIGTALQGVAHCELAFQNALEYARQRGSLRALSGTKNPDRENDLIIHHPNVRHNILMGKAIAEGGRCFVMDMGRMTDLQNVATSESEKKRISNEIGLLTPIAKGFLTELCFEAAAAAQSVWGGHGYVKGNGMEQIVRDARIATIYEGTTSIQALDLLGRKVLLAKTNDIPKLNARIGSLVKNYLFSGGPLGSMARQLFGTHLSWKILILRLKAMALRNKESVGSASQDFLMASGYLVLGFYWLKMAAVADAKVKAGQDPTGFYQAKVDTAQFYFVRLLPRFTSHAAVAVSPPESVLKIKEDHIDL